MSQNTRCYCKNLLKIVVAKEIQFLVWFIPYEYQSHAILHLYFCFVYDFVYFIKFYAEHEQRKY